MMPSYNDFIEFVLFRFLQFMKQKSYVMFIVFQPLLHCVDCTGKYNVDVNNLFIFCFLLLRM